MKLLSYFQNWTWNFLKPEELETLSRYWHLTEFMEFSETNTFWQLSQTRYLKWTSTPFIRGVCCLAGTRRRLADKPLIYWLVWGRHQQQRMLSSSQVSKMRVRSSRLPESTPGERVQPERNDAKKMTTMAVVHLAAAALSRGMQPIDIGLG